MIYPRLDDNVARIIVSRRCPRESPWLDAPCEGTKYTDCLEWRIEQARTVAASCGKNGRDLPTPCFAVSHLSSVVVTGWWRVSRTATACTSSIRSYGHELGKTANLAHAPNYAWTTRFYPIFCALLLPVLAAAAAAAAASATTAMHFCHSSVSFSHFLMPFHLAPSSLSAPSVSLLLKTAISLWIQRPRTWRTLLPRRTYEQKLRSMCLLPGVVPLTPFPSLSFLCF